MIRIQITQKHYRRLRKLVDLLDKSVAQQVREAIESYLICYEGNARTKVIEVAGKFAPLANIPGELMRYDQLYAESIAERKSRA